MRICVVGNSQVAALVEARTDFENVSIDFYSIPGGGGPALKVESGRLFPCNPDREIHSTIEDVASSGLCLEGYDAVLLSGIGMSAARRCNNNIYRKIIATKFLPDSYDIHNLNGLLVSSEIFKISLDSELRNLSCLKTMKIIRELYKGEIFVQLFPLPATSVVFQEDFNLCYKENLGNFFAMCYCEQIKIINTFIDEIGGGIHILPVPNDEWLTNGFTPVEYSSPTDAWHMNEKYGYIVFKELLAINGSVSIE